MNNIWLAGTGLTCSETSIDFPRADRLVQGNPKRQTQSLYEHPNMNCGIWQCEVGAWNIVFAENKQEFFTVIEGKVRLHNQDRSHYIDVGVGEAGVIPPGFMGTFEVLEPVKKYFVLVEA